MRDIQTDSSKVNLERHSYKIKQTNNSKQNKTLIKKEKATKTTPKNLGLSEILWKGILMFFSNSVNSLISMVKFVKSERDCIYDSMNISDIICELDI